MIQRDGFTARMITGFVLCCIVIIDIYLLRQVSLWFADALIFLVVLGATYEMNKAYKMNNLLPMSWLTYASAVVNFLLCALFYDTFGAAIIMVGVLAFVMLALAVFTFQHKYKLIDMIATLAILLYPQLLISMFYMLNHNMTFGLIIITAALAASIMTDSCALFSGLCLKKIFPKKLCPSISPKKTVVGMIGGLVGAVIGAMLPVVLFGVLPWFNGMKGVDTLAFQELGPITFLWFGIFGLIAGIANTIGDLCASWIKRQSGLKDYSKIFPGHGGIMDRLDGMSFVLPLAYIFMILVF